MDVWETLGIDKTEDERAIKKAYAKQLKTIRPDEEPKLFQTLREARDEAIYLARFDFDYEWDEGADDGLELAPNTANETYPSAELTSEFQNEKLADELPAALISDDLLPGSLENSELEQGLKEQEVVADGSYVLTLEEGDAPELKTNLDADNVHPIPPISEEQNGEALHVSTSDLFPLFEQETPDNIDHKQSDLGFFDVDIDEVIYEHIDDEIENLMGPWCAWDTGEWKNFINRARECSFDISNYAEYEVLSAIGESLDDFVVLDNHYKEEARRYILSYLNEEYGWTQNDRPVYAILPENQAESLMIFLRTGQKNSSSAASESFYDSFGFPLLSEKHFNDYIGQSDSVFEDYYNKCKNEGRELKLSWSWPGFIFSPFWLAHRCNDGFEALNGMIYILALIILHYGVTSPDLLFTFIAGFMIISLHVFVGAFGKKLVVTTMASSLHDLAEDNDLGKDEKLKKLATIGRGGIRGIYDFVTGMIGIAIISGVIYGVLLWP